MPGNRKAESRLYCGSHMQIIHPNNASHWLRLRTQDVTSTEIAALFGCSPYLTRYELWHRKKTHQAGSVEATERIKWGSRLQDAIAAGIAEEQGWQIRRMSEYIRLPELRIGASFDFSIEPDGLLEVKNVDALQYRDGWIVDGSEVEAPAHIELQVQHQMLVSGRQWAYIGALVGGNRLILLRREPIQSVQAAIRQKAAEFWRSVDAGEEPSPIWPEDAETVIKLASYAEPGTVMIGTDEVTELATEYKRLSEDAKRIDQDREVLKAKILLAIGDSEKVKGDKYTISAGITGEAEISYVRKAYRNFKITWKKEK